MNSLKKIVTKRNHQEPDRARRMIDIAKTYGVYKK